MIDSSFLKKDKEIIDYLNDVKTNHIKDMMSSDLNWALDDLKIEENPNEVFEDNFNTDWKKNYIGKNNINGIPRYVYVHRNERKPVGFIDKTISLEDNKYEYELAELLRKHFKKVVHRRDWWWYKPKNWMAYHTNAEKETMWRVYFVWADESDKSYVNYYDRKNNKVITIWDKKGWNINYFKIGKIGEENPHCIWSDCNRVSMGFKVWTG